MKEEEDKLEELEQGTPIKCLKLTWWMWGKTRATTTNMPKSMREKGQGPSTLHNELQAPKECWSSSLGNSTLIGYTILHYQPGKHTY